MPIPMLMRGLSGAKAPAQVIDVEMVTAIMRPLTITLNTAPAQFYSSTVSFFTGAGSFSRAGGVTNRCGVVATLTVRSP